MPVVHTSDECGWMCGSPPAQGGRSILPVFSGLAKRDREKKREGKGGQTRKIKGKAKKMTIGRKKFEKRSFFLNLERLPSIYYPEPRGP